MKREWDGEGVERNSTSVLRMCCAWRAGVLADEEIAKQDAGNFDEDERRVIQIKIKMFVI